MELYQLVRENLWLILFLMWGWPLFKYRSKFRKMVYQTEDWRINIQPRFAKEWEALWEDLYPENEEYLELRNFYRFYLLVYIGLFLLWNFA